MTPHDEITEKIDGFIMGAYGVEDVDHVPTVEEIPFDNRGLQLDACVFFVDLRQSSVLTNTFRRQTVAKIHKAFLWAAVRLARDCSGDVRSFGGDSILAVFTGASKEKCAVQCALRLKFVLQSVLKPKLQRFFDAKRTAEDRFDLDFGMGVAAGSILVVKAGFRGEANQDLVWIGCTTNLAAKLADAGCAPYNIYASKEVFDVLPTELRVASYQEMWEASNVLFGGQATTVYRTSCGESF